MDNILLMFTKEKDNYTRIISGTSEVYIDKDKRFVLKFVMTSERMNTCENMWSKKHLNRDLYKREKYLGSILNRFDWYPELLYSDDDQNLLIFRYAGIPLTPDNAPDDVCFQYDNIMKDMESLNINHNDIKNGELLINNGKIYLCDFGWGSINNNMNCGIDIW